MRKRSELLLSVLYGFDSPGNHRHLPRRRTLLLLIHGVVLWRPVRESSLSFHPGCLQLSRRIRITSHHWQNLFPGQYIGGVANRPGGMGGGEKLNRIIFFMRRLFADIGILYGPFVFLILYPVGPSIISACEVDDLPRCIYWCEQTNSQVLIRRALPR